MSSSTKHAVLGLLVRQPAHGYALTQHLRRWAAPDSDVGHSSVYNAIRALQAGRLIEPVPPESGSHAESTPKIAFRATSAGEAEFDAWMAAEPGNYDELRLRLALGRPADLEALLRHVVAAHETTVRALQDLPESSFDRLVDGRDPWADFETAILGAFESSEYAARAKTLHSTRVMLTRLLKQRTSQRDVR